MASLGDVRQTFSSWDACMSKEYCKWPAIVGIIIGSLVVVSVLFCIARCLCFGAECCACCFSCLSCCCPSRRRRGTRGYENFQHPPPPPPPVPYGHQYPQYSSHPALVYSQPSPYRGPQTATFQSPVKSQTRYNEDALPAMPTWDTSATRHVEEEPVEMDRLGTTQRTQQQHLLAGQEEDQYGQRGYTQTLQAYAPSPQAYNQYSRGYPQSPRERAPSDSEYTPSIQHADQYRGQGHGYAGDVGNTSAVPYHDYNSHRQYAQSMSPVSSTAYAPSATVPPSYHTREPSVVSPIQSSYNPMPSRRPVQGSWRDV